MELLGKNGYTISYEESIPKDCNTVIIAMHGFAGDKESSCISMLEKAVNELGIGLVKFDWPAHGESETDGFNLTIDNCLSDLNSIVEYLKNKNNNYSLVAFATSFGGYLTLLYNYHYPNTFKHIILRSPAIKMYDVLTNNLLTAKIQENLRTNHYFNFGYERIIQITDNFVNQLKENDLFKLYNNKKLDYVSIIHGTLDDTVPITDSIEFADYHDCAIYKVEGADHRYKNEGELDKVIEITTNILNSNMPQIIN